MKLELNLEIPYIFWTARRMLWYSIKKRAFFFTYKKSNLIPSTSYLCELMSVPEWATLFCPFTENGKQQISEMKERCTWQVHTVTSLIPLRQTSKTLVGVLH